MKKSFLKKILSALSLLFLAIITNNSFALSSDKNQLAQFISGYAVFNQKTGVNIFMNHVQMNQGTTHLIGDKVTSYKDSSGKIYKVVALGNLAHYSTLPDEQKNVLNAYANTIEYYPQKGLAILIGNGKLIQGENSFTGPRIVYDIKKQTITSTPSEKGSRSVIIIQPQALPGEKS